MRVYIGNNLLTYRVKCKILMRIESKHNPEIFKAENLERWDRIWKDKVVNHYIFLAASIAFLFVAIILIKNGNQTGFIFLSISLFGLMVTINFLTQANKEKK